MSNQTGGSNSLIIWRIESAVRDLSGSLAGCNFGVLDSPKQNC